MTTLTTHEAPSRRGLKALPRGIKIAIAAVILVSAIFQARKGILELAPGFGADLEVAAMSQRAAEASGQLLAQFKDVRRNGNAPRQTDAKVGPLLSAVFGADTLKSKTNLATRDLEALGGWSTAATQAGMFYLFAGTGVADPAKAPDDPKLAQQFNRNVAAYAPEVGRYLDAVLTINGKMAELVVNNSDSIDEEAKSKDLKAQVQFRAASVIYGAIQVFNIKLVADDWRRDRLPALSYAIPRAAKLVSADQCRELRDLARSTAAAMRDPAVKRGLEGVSAALKC